MNLFKKLFGIDKNQIKETCILLPVLSKNILKEFKVTKVNNGFPFSSISTKDFTIIHTNIGAPFIGDCILYLEHTLCKNIILLGSCGAIQKSKTFQIGTLVSPERCYELESFSQMLNNKKSAYSYYPDKLLIKSLTDIKKVNCATVGSIKLEKEYIKFFLSKNISILDMECSSFFNAAYKTNKKAIAIFYITDFLNIKSPYVQKTHGEKQAILTAQKRGIDIIKSITTNKE